MASFITTIPELKLVPESLDALLKERQSYQDLDRDSEPPPRAKLCYYALSSSKIKRPFNTAMILLVGKSGVGKSSTINHLFDTGEGNPVAMTSDRTSATKATTEYVLSIDEPKYEVCDLKMRVVDTPGFNDTAGINQDACNFVSIKRFFETHPSLRKQTFPNLVFLVVNAMDQRIEGPNSDVFKCLKGIKLLNVIDTSRPNLVVIVTFCCSVAHKNANRWNEKMKQKKHLISEAVYEVLGIYAPLVLIENEYAEDEHDLERSGDYTFLPSGEKQPKNLYDACLKLLQRSEDHFGLMVLNAAFERCKKDRPTIGHEVEATDSRVKPLSEQEKEFSNAFTKAAKEGNPLVLRMMQYIKEMKLDETQEEELMKLVETMNSLGLSNKERLQTATIGEINCVHSEEISTHGMKMLKEKFGINNEIATYNPDEFVGQGYNIIIDKSVPAQIMTFSAINDTKFGFRIPACAKINKVNETREWQIDFESEEAYKMSRLQNLGLNVDLAPILLKIPIAPRLGFSASGKNNCSGKSMETTKSSLIEYRMAKISIPNLKSDDISFTEDFHSAVKKLPGTYTSEEKLKQKFEKFFNRFGHFVVVSAYVGGAVKVKIRHESSGRLKEDQPSVGGSVGANVPGVIGVNVSGKYQRSTGSASNVVLNITDTWWQGGRSDLHTKSTLQSEERMLMWKASLSKEPVLLTTEMSLEPISSIVAIIDETKEEACYQALRGCFDGKDLHPVRNLQDQLALEEKKKIEKYEQQRRRNEANLRSQTILEPDDTEWWEYLLAPVYLVWILYDSIVDFFDDL